MLKVCRIHIGNNVLRPELVFCICSSFTFLSIYCFSLVDTSCVIPLLLLLMGSCCSMRISRLGIVLAFFCFPILYGLMCLCSGRVPFAWGLGLAITFMISLGIFALWIVLLKEKRLKDQNLRENLESQCIQLKESYDKEVKEREVSCSFWEQRVQLLSNELENCRSQLQESSRSQERLALDLQILSEQKSTWLEGYTELYNEYIRLVTMPNTVMEESFEKDAQWREEHRMMQMRMQELQETVVTKDAEIAQLRVQVGEPAYKSKYLQLRKQFADKDAALSQARKELFQTQEKLLTAQREAHAAAMIMDLEEVELVHNLLVQIEALEEEISCLEVLVSHIQSQ